eukprot:175848_1
MACACPCFGDEADAEEKPNQMIQLDGLGMLRLDTQHVGQGSQGARSAKWFYFGETDNRLAVVNLLLCITCAMMWLCIFLAAQKGAFTLTAPKKLIVAEQHSEAIVEDTTNDAKTLQQKYVQLEKQHKKLVATYNSMDEQFVAQKGWSKDKQKLTKKVAKLEDEKVQLGKDLLQQHQAAQQVWLTDKQKLTKKVAKLDGLVKQYNQSERSKDDLLDRYRKGKLPTFSSYFASHDPEDVEDEEQKKEMERKRLNNTDDPEAYQEWLVNKEKEVAQKEAYEEWLANKENESKGGEDSNKDINYDKSNDHDNNTNDVGTNDANQ